MSKKEKPSTFISLYNPYLLGEGTDYANAVRTYLSDPDLICAIGETTFCKAFLIERITLREEPRLLVSLSEEMFRTGITLRKTILIDDNSSEYSIEGIEMARVLPEYIEWHMKIVTFLLAGPTDTVGHYFAKAPE